MSPSRPSRATSLAIVGTVTMVAVAVVGLGLPPVAQSAAYHRFADGRTLLGIPNALNVLSNLPFLIIGLVGGATALRAPVVRGAPWERGALVVLFGGVAVVAFGSGAYHLEPGDARLAWDRAPMTVVFMALFTIVVGDWIGPRAGAWLFAPLVLGGIGSVIAWRMTGDLRAYGLVQFLPMLLVPIILVLFPAPPFGGTRALAGAAAFYALAKVLERLDGWVFSLGHVVSGHTLKHLAAGLATSSFLGLLRPRGPRHPPA